MTTPVSAVVTAVMAALQTAPAVAAQVARVRLRPFDAQTNSAVVVRPISVQCEDSTINQVAPDVWAVRLAVECYSRSTGAADVDAAVDALVKAVYARMMTSSVVSAAAPHGLTPQGVNYDFDVAGEDFVCATFVFEARAGSAALLN